MDLFARFLPSKEDHEASCEKVPATRPCTRYSQNVDHHSQDADGSLDYLACDGDFEAVVPLNLNLPVVQFTMEKDIPVPVPSSARAAPPSVSPVVSAVVSEEESSVEEDLAVGSQNENLPEILPADLPVPAPEIIPAMSPLGEVPSEEPCQPVATDAEPPVVTDVVDHDSTLRRSTRQRIAPDRLQYTALGKPLVSVVQMLLHSLSDILGVSPPSDSVVLSIEVV